MVMDSEVAGVFGPNRKRRVHCVVRRQHSDTLHPGGGKHGVHGEDEEKDSGQDLAALT